MTGADEYLLSTATRYAVMSYRQAESWVYGGVERTALKRVGYMREAGMLRQSRLDEWAGRVLMATAGGARLIREELSVPLEAAQQHPGERLLHRLAVTDTGLRYEHHEVPTLTEREVRTVEYHHRSQMAAKVLVEAGVDSPRSTSDGQGNERFLAVPMRAEGLALHYPDLVVVEDGEGVTAVEVEVNVKPKDRLRDILLAYRRAGVFDRVLYLCTPAVAAVLHGFRHFDGPQAGEWEDGLLQRLELLPPGPPDYHQRERPKGHVRVDVAMYVPDDAGLAYRLDMRQVPEAWWVSKPEWEELRRLWAADTETGKAARVPFLRWWRDIWWPAERAAAIQKRPVGQLLG